MTGKAEFWQWMKHAKLYSDLLQDLKREHLTVALGSVYGGPYFQQLTYISAKK